MERLVRCIFIALALASFVPFALFAVGGFITWQQEVSVATNGYASTFAAAFVLLVFIPGGGPLLAAIYYWIYLKDPMQNFVGLFVVLFLAIGHFVFAAYEIHGKVFEAFFVGGAELVLTLVIVKLVRRYIFVRLNYRN